MRLNWTVRGAGPPLLLLHGFTGIGADWLAIFDPDDTGFRLLMPDLPGHGSSPRLDPFTFREAARAVAADLREMGMSGGGQVLLHLATAQPAMVTRSVLVSTAPSFPDTARTLMARAAPDAQPPEVWDELRAKHPGGDAQVRHLLATAQGFHASEGDVDFTPEDLARVRGGCLVVHGDSDPLYPVACAEALRDGIPDAQLLRLPGAGHCPVFGPQAPAFAQRALDFIGKPACHEPS